MKPHEQIKPFHMKNRGHVFRDASFGVGHDQAGNVRLAGGGGTVVCGDCNAMHPNPHEGWLATDILPCGHALCELMPL